jgi:hypothetical protein
MRADLEAEVAGVPPHQLVDAIRCKRRVDASSGRAAKQTAWPDMGFEKEVDP